jgi:hypothetical protein
MRNTVKFQKENLKESDPLRKRNHKRQGSIIKDLGEIGYED